MKQTDPTGRRGAACPRRSKTCRTVWGAGAGGGGTARLSILIDAGPVFLQLPVSVHERLGCGVRFSPRSQ